MKRFSSKALLVLASFASLVVLAAAPVAAEHGNGSGGTDDSISSGVTTGDNTGTHDTSGGSNTETDNDNSATQATDNETENETHHEKMEGLLGTLRSEAHSNLAQRREGKKLLSETGRQQACEEHQASIDRKVTRFGTQAQQHLDVFSNIFGKVQSFQTNEKLDAPDYANLVATANAKKDTAATAVAALQSLSVNIDCSASDPAATLETLQASVKDTRQTLQDYRQAIVDVINSLRAAKDTTTNQEAN